MVIAVTEHARRPGCLCAPCSRPPEAPAGGDTIIVGRVKYRIVKVATWRRGTVFTLSNSPAWTVTHQLIVADVESVAWSPVLRLWRLVGPSRVRAVARLMLEPAR